eukprot:gene3373-2140_t
MLGLGFIDPTSEGRIEGQSFCPSYIAILNRKPGLDRGAWKLNGL